MLKTLDTSLQKKIGFIPHKAQREILKSKEREVVICAGRRFGKSSICAFVALKTLILGDKKGKPVKIWIVSPTYDLSQKVFEYLVKWFLKVFPSQSGGVSFRPFPQIKTARGSLIQCKSAENPTGLLGEELDLLIVDECSRIKKNIYETYLYPATTSRQGRTFFISSPFGKNWFYDQWLKAKETNSAFQFSSLDGVSISKEEWLRAKNKLPNDVFKQEFEAAFLEGAGSVFRGIRGVIDSTYEAPQVHHRYIAGLDLAKFRDFTVLTIMDREEQRVVYFDRFNKIPYTLQKKRIIAALDNYKAKVVVDALNIGASMSDDLRAEGIMVEDFKAVGTTSKDVAKKGTKERLIEKLASMIEEHSIKIPPQEELIDELESYSYILTDSGNLKYGAPQGLHDDTVISLALACWNLKGKSRQEQTKINQNTHIIKKRFQYL